MRSLSRRPYYSPPYKGVVVLSQAYILIVWVGAVLFRDVARLSVDDCLLLLRARGVRNSEEFRHLGRRVLLDTICWYDEQDGRVGVGVLIDELRRGGRRTARTVLDVQTEYAESIRAKLCRHVPEVGAHPAAVAYVVRLGKGARIKPAAIRAAVRAFDEKWGTGHLTQRARGEVSDGNHADPQRRAGQSAAAEAGRVA